MAAEKILIFHQDANVLKSVSQSLSSLGFSVISSSNVQYTLELARQEKPHFLVWGDELTLQAKKSLRALKDSEVGRNISILAIGNGSDLNLYDRVEAQHYGIDDFIPDINDVSQIQSRIHFHQRYNKQIRSNNDKVKRFRLLSESTISLMLSRGIVNVCEILNDFFVNAYPLNFHILAVKTSEHGDFDYFNLSNTNTKMLVNVDKVRRDPIWHDKFIGVEKLKDGPVSDAKVVDALKSWGLEFNQAHQFILTMRGKSVGSILFALPKGTEMDAEENTLLIALFRSASQRLTEIKRMYSLERDGTKRMPEVKSYFEKPSESEILILLSKLLISQLQPDITLYMNYHEGFKFLYPKYCFRGDDRKNLFEKDRPPVLLLKDFSVFDAVLDNKKTVIVDMKRGGPGQQLKNMPGLDNAEINNIIIIPLMGAQTIQGFFVIGRASFLEKFSNREIQESETLIKQGAGALEEDQILRNAKLTVKQLNRIFSLGSELTLDLTLDKLLEKVCVAIRRTIGWNVVLLDLKDQYGETFTNLQILGMNEKDYKKMLDLEGYPSFAKRLDISFPLGNSYFYDHKQKYSAEEPLNTRYFEEQTGSEWNDKDWIYVPITSRGKLLAVLSLNDPVERKRPTIERISSVEYFANQAAVIIENYELVEGVKSSELKYRLLAETMTMGLVTCEPDRKIIYVNQSLATLLNYESPEQMIGKKLCDFTETNSRPKLIKAVHDILREDKTPDEKNDQTEGVELELVAEDEEVIPFMVYMSPFYQHGKRIGFFSVLADLRNQKKIERLKADFNSMIVHDLRSPLNIIQGYVDIVRTEVVGTITEEQAELLTIAKENVFKVLKLIDNFLIASKLEAGHFQIEASINSMNGLVDTIWDHYQVLAKEKKIELVKDLDENLPLFSFDKFRIEQVVRNFLSNALKFTPPEGSISLTTKLKKSKNEISKEMQMHADVSVIDTGVGIPEDELEKVFNKYEQTEAGKDASLKGTGLGLAICREIVDLHNGEVWVKSDLHQGSTFGFSLPIQALKI